MNEVLADRAGWFDRLYRDRDDPWDLCSAYEQEKYRATLDALPRERFGSALEIGCGAGVMTEALALRCDTLLALDVSDVALNAARRRVNAGSVTFLRAEIPGDWPTGKYDLILFSEVLYFLSEAEVRQCARFAARDLLPGGACLLVDWTGENDMPLDGDAAAECFIAEAGRGGLVTEETVTCPKYRVDRLTALPA